jgi:hypothetical protein
MTELVPGPLHADVAHLAFLLGTWRGRGRGEYPTIEAFDYEEEVRFEHVGDDYLFYTQRSWSPEDGAPIHFERGFLRPGGERRVELTVAHVIGLTEVAEGRADGAGFEVATTVIGRTATGMDVNGLERRYRVDGEVLSYEVDMATGATPLRRHLTAELRRVEE